MTSKYKRSQDRHREAGLAPVQVWIYKDDDKARAKVMAEDKRKEVKASRSKGK